MYISQDRSQPFCRIFCHSKIIILEKFYYIINDENRHLIRERVELGDHRFIGDLFFKWKGLGAEGLVDSWSWVWVLIGF